MKKELIMDINVDEDGGLITTLRGDSKQILQASLKVPFSIEGFHRILEDFGVPIHGVPKPNRQPPSEISQEDIGRTLFECLFFQDPELGNYWLQVLKDTNERLRLLLKMDVSNGKLKDFLAIPWEAMLHNNAGQFYSHHRHMGIAYQLRNPFQPARTPPLQTKPVLKLGLVLAEPKDAERFEKGKFYNDLVTSLKEHLEWHQLDIELITPPTRNQLKTILAKSSFDFLQFVGHGGFSKKKGEWCFWLEDQEGFSDSLTAKELGCLLEPQKDHLRLFTLVTCEGARFDNWSNHNWFGGMAGELLMKGIANVIAMQFPISIQAARAFNHGFYPALLETQNFDSALATTRAAMYTAENLEWATPSLFTGQNEAEVFEPSDQAALLINTVDPTDRRIKPNPTMLTFSKDFHQFFDHRVPKNDQIWSQIEDEVWELKRTSLRRANEIIVEGQAALSLWALIGFVFNKTSRVHLIANQWNGRAIQKWCSHEAQVETDPMFRGVVNGTGSRDIIITIGISQAVDNDVSAYLQERNMSYRSWYQFGVADGDTHIKDSSHAANLARVMAKTIKSKIKETTYPGKTHLFLSAPAGFAMLLGWGMNAVRNLQLYEWGQGTYHPSLVLERKYG